MAFNPPNSSPILQLPYNKYRLLNKFNKAATLNCIACGEYFLTINASQGSSVLGLVKTDWNAS